MVRFYIKTSTKVNNEMSHSSQNNGHLKMALSIKNVTLNFGNSFRNPSIGIFWHFAIYLQKRQRK